MDLWIRSQDKREFVKAEHIEASQFSDDEFIVDVNAMYFGSYKTKERAIEVLDEIQRCFKGRTIISPRKMTDYEGIKKEFFDSGFIITDGSVDIIPSDVIVYEIPKE